MQFDHILLRSLSKKIIIRRNFSVHVHQELVLKSFGNGVNLLNSNQELGLFALYKPPGVLSHPNSNREYSKQALISQPYCMASEAYLFQLDQGTIAKLWLLHRLDSATSGVILVCSNEGVARIIKDTFKARKVHKQYIAAVFGRFQKQQLWVDNMSVKKTDYVRAISSISNNYSSLEAKTRVRGLTFNSATCVSQIELMPFTGYTHQLRYQCSKRNLPIVGDRTYGNFKSNKNVSLLGGIPRRLYLHASTLSIDVLGQQFVATCPLPLEFKDLLSYKNS